MTRETMLRRRVRYLWHDVDPEPVELLSAILSLSMAVVLLWRGNGAATLDHAYFYAALCFVSGSSKVIGVLFQKKALRIGGLLLGTFFWVTLSFTLVRFGNASITWLLFSVLAGAQIWAARLVVRQ